MSLFIYIFHSVYLFLQEYISHSICISTLYVLYSVYVSTPCIPHFVFIYHTIYTSLCIYIPLCTYIHPMYIPLLICIYSFYTPLYDCIPFSIFNSMYTSFRTPYILYSVCIYHLVCTLFFIYTGLFSIYNHGLIGALVVHNSKKKNYFSIITIVKGVL